jgi:Putative mono-oxygenase ydhR
MKGRSMTILQIDFPSHGPWGPELTRKCTDLARHLSNTPGMHWKLWTENEHTGDCGGIYLFADEASASNFLDEHLKRLESMGIKDVRAKLFDVNEDLSRITHAPLVSAAAA